jgi:hypothetical protein
MLRFTIKNDETIYSGTNGNFSIDLTPYNLPSPTGRYKLTLDNVNIYSSTLYHHIKYITTDLIDNSISNINGAFNIFCNILLSMDNDGTTYTGCLNSPIKYDISQFNKIVNFKIYDEDGTIDDGAVCILEFTIKSINK